MGREILFHAWEVSGPGRAEHDSADQPGSQGIAGCVAGLARHCSADPAIVSQICGAGEQGRAGVGVPGYGRDVAVEI
jgi:hypothetical protein